MITHVKLSNFKRFKSIEINFNDSINLLIGDNESGKSTILTAIDLVLSGSRSKVETYGLENLFNNEVIADFLKSEKRVEDLPKMYIELYFKDLGNMDLEGKYNSSDSNCHGLLLLCEPRIDLLKEIASILKEEITNFPFEYYSITFKTFSGESYSSYKRFINYLLLDNTQINNEHATKAYIKTLYTSHSFDSEMTKHQFQYRKHKDQFQINVLKDLNDRLENNYSFSIRTSSKDNLETDLTIREENIAIENRGKGRQCFMKADFALQKSKKELEIVLIEEPENHLSHLNMKKLIRRIYESTNKQLFIATHSNLISSRLDLRNSILLNSNSVHPVPLQSLSKETAEFFMKAPDNNILEYTLSKKVILVEGDAEYILMKCFFDKGSESGGDKDVHIISVGGTSFKRYLELGALLDIKTAVIRDNDGDYKNNCIDRYEGLINSKAAIFADEDDSIRTFEMAIYVNNKEICDYIFGTSRRSLTVEQYMLANKTEAAFELLDKHENDLVAPSYIQKAIEWIKN